MQMIYGWAAKDGKTLYMSEFLPLLSQVISALVAGAWTERKKMFHGGSFLKLADDDV